MKEVTTRYYCDRCGAEVRPYGKLEEISRGYGFVAFTSGHIEPRSGMFYEVDDDDIFQPDAAGSKCAMALCKECFDGLTAYLRNE